MSVKATDVRKGHVLEKDGDLLLITEYIHKTPGNLRSIIQIKTKSLINGAAGSMRLSGNDSVDVAFLDRKKTEYLYKDGEGTYIFMDAETYDQFPLAEELIGDKMGFVSPNSTVEVTFHGTTPIGVELPPSVVLEVIEAEAAVKGNSATNVKKNAVVETGMTVKVPMHIGVGEKIKIHTDTGDFLGRANE
ncbi:elongation factor P [Engelhardtia mirabilis]|uniref:Elongation factor P n=1 Tax=Engelhardtia mirabilis TaxID=2528011 RepID=A0A518BKD9_9BACT|nr:Elongation factor P [Planctomycetes bacterium Pla133]QDV01767.1 Elongation factor P [Planctomycetes bacterium Pla86]